MTKKEAKQLFISIMNINVKSIEELETGFSNQNFIINDAYVLRVLRENRDETISINEEIENYEALKDFKNKETLLYLDINTGIKITKFIHQTHYYSSPIQDEEILLVSKLIKKLHHLDIKANHQYNMIEKLKIYKENTPLNEQIDNSYEEEIINKINKITMKKPLFFSHNDLVKGNLLFKNNKLCLIDWEYASLNYEYFDLASFISENNLNNDQAILFLKEYYKSKLNNKIIEDINVFIKFLDLLFYYWASYYKIKRGDKIYSFIQLEKKERIINPLLLKLQYN